MLSIHGPSILVASFNYTVSHSHYDLRSPFLLHKIFVTPSPPQLLLLTTCYHLHSFVGDPWSDSYGRRVHGIPTMPSPLINFSSNAQITDLLLPYPTHLTIKNTGGNIYYPCFFFEIFISKILQFKTKSMNLYKNYNHENIWTS